MAKEKMREVEMPEFKKIMKGELGDKESLNKINGFMKQIFEKHGEFRVIDTVEETSYLITVKEKKVKWKEEKRKK